MVLVCLAHSLQMCLIDGRWGDDYTDPRIWFCQWTTPLSQSKMAGSTSQPIGVCISIRLSLAKTLFHLWSEWIHLLDVCIERDRVHVLWHTQKETRCTLYGTHRKRMCMFYSTYRKGHSACFMAHRQRDSAFFMAHRERDIVLALWHTQKETYCLLYDTHRDIVHVLWHI